MDQIPIYNLLQAIDPTKINVPIRDRFAKLTLSSNKKKQQQNKPELQEAFQRQQDKRDRVSRDISKQFDVDEYQQKLIENPLLRSESSKDTEQQNSTDLEVEEMTMDPLKVTQDYDNPTQLEDEVEFLSQQIASMAMESKPISLSSGSIDNLSEYIPIVSSSESQRSSCSAVDNIHIVHNIPINVKEAIKQATIPLNLSASTNDGYDKTYEMTDDEDEVWSEDDDEEKPITISDTSESYEQEQDIMSTSSLPSTTLTSENLVLPSITDDKAERVAAFLRDVSIERRAIMEQGQIEFHDTVDQLLNKQIDEAQETLLKSRQIAAADTESMTPDVDEEVTPKAIMDREKRLKNLDESLEKEQEALNKSKNNGNKNTRNIVLKEGNHDEKTRKHVTLSGAKINKNNSAYRMANDETQCNSEYSINEDANVTPKTHNFNNNLTQQNADNSRRLANYETEANTEVSSTEINNPSPNKTKQFGPRRLINEDTMANSLLADITQQSLLHNYAQDYKTPQKSGKSISNNDTINNSSISIHSTPQSATNSGDKLDSFNSIINSSAEFNDTAPQHSITILETDDEDVQEKSCNKNESSDDKKLSNSFHREESSDDSEYNEQMSRIQMSTTSINISAKINIKIRISSTTETSEDEQNDDSERKDEKNNKESIETQNISENNNEVESLNNDDSIGSNEQSKASDKAETLCNQLRSKATGKDKLLYSPNKSSESLNKSSESLNKSSGAFNQSSDHIDIVEVTEDPKFLNEAEKLLTQLYGKAWQTPDVIRTLKRSSQSGNKTQNTNSKSSRKKNDIKNIKETKSGNRSSVEESILLDDFSIFRRNIVKTDLHSTRLVTPKTRAPPNKEVFTEPRNIKKTFIEKDKSDAAKLMPQTERKPLGCPPVAKVVINKGRIIDDKWRRLVDDDSTSEGDNASDDDDADKSWSKNASEIEKDISNSDVEISPLPKARNRKRNNTSNKCLGRSDKSDILTKKLNKSKANEIVYLDLSKEEVEVQDEVPESPPANHDVTFASRLQDILKTCRHEDKAKLPPSTKKTKRKLFTPNFGDCDFEADLSKENEQNTTETACRNDAENEILDDKINCPFDSLGRPKVLEVLNKPLESVKTKNDKNTKTIGASSNTPKSKPDNEPIFKTPLTIKSKAPSKTVKELSQALDYKYSFLKSLDVTVSKVFCHPDALYYRDNYRLKKEDLSKLLYDMYNEKLFQNKLNVPVKWNKKLTNTAGRCLNHKRMGVRSSTVELSDKVLTSADRLRCTLIHELCHAATWVFDGEGGHGSAWKEWARRANATFPALPKITVCHQYEIEYKYTYKCTLCASKSYAHSKSKKVENIRCAFCHGAIEIFLNKKDKDGNIMPTPVKEPTGFAKFVKDNYKKFKSDDLKHADVMKILSTEFGSLKVTAN